MSKKMRIVRCSWSQAPEGSPLKCGWTGRSDKYLKHLAENHGGQDYKPPEVGLPAE